MNKESIKNLFSLHYQWDSTVVFCSSDMLRERTEILEERLERNTAQLNICRQEAIAKDTAIAQLQQQSRERTEQLMAITDHKFDVKVSIPTEVENVLLSGSIVLL